MAYEQKDNSFSLFKNKKENETQPDYTGTAKWKGETIRISAWIKKREGKESFMSGLLSEPYKKD
jgi:hypothetical protein